MYVVMRSDNRKIGDMAATYLPIAQTCPSTCPHKGNGCYAQIGHVGFQVMRLERTLAGKKPYDIIRQEAREIARRGREAKGRSLRLHVSGDVQTDAATRLLGQAALRWDGSVFGYTHSWRQVQRTSWGRISILASCESMLQASQAWERGYAASVLVPEHKTDKAYMVSLRDPTSGWMGEMKVIPCPQQTRNVTCEKCGLCMKDRMLHDQKAVIAFAAHGPTRKRVTLTVLKEV